MPKDFSPLSMEAPAVRFDCLKNSFEFSFLLDKSQLQILLKCLKTDRVFYILFLFNQYDVPPKSRKHWIDSWLVIYSGNFLTSLRVSMHAFSFKKFPFPSFEPIAAANFISWLWPEFSKPLV